MFWHFVLYKLTPQDKHILSMKEEDNFILHCDLQAAVGWWKKQFSDMVKSSVWKTKAVKCSRRDSFSNPWPADQ